jgi:hypothetical protein
MDSHYIKPDEGRLKAEMGKFHKWLIPAFSATVDQTVDQASKIG